MSNHSTAKRIISSTWHITEHRIAGYTCASASLVPLSSKQARTIWNDENATTSRASSVPRRARTAATRKRPASGGSTAASAAETDTDGTDGATWAMLVRRRRSGKSDDYVTLHYITHAPLPARPPTGLRSSRWTTSTRGPPPPRPDGRAGTAAALRAVELCWPPCP
jgi:hypothetical protein